MITIIITITHVIVIITILMGVLKKPTSNLSKSIHSATGLNTLKPTDSDWALLNLQIIITLLFTFTQVQKYIYPAQR